MDYTTENGCVLFDGSPMTTKAIVNALNSKKERTKLIKATAHDILIKDIQDYYIKADNLSFKEGLEAMHEGLLYMVVKDV